MQFDFNQQRIAQDSIEVEDIGNVCIEGYNDTGYAFYLIIITYLGVSKIITFGPVMPDLDELVDKFQLNHIELNYDNKKLWKQITMWLNDSKKLTSAKIIDQDTAISCIPDLRELVKNIKDSE